MMPHEADDALAFLVREAKPFEKRPGHFGSDALVLVERVVVVLVAPFPRARLADVMKQPRNAQHRLGGARVEALHRVTPHVERMKSILLTPDGFDELGCR